MHEKLIKEINKLPNVLTRQQLINWYLDNRKSISSSPTEITTGKLIKLCKQCGKKIEGQSKLAIHITEEEEADFIRRCKPDVTGRKANSNIKIADTESSKINKLYWQKGKTIEQLAELYKCSTSTVGAFMDKVGIPKRLRGTAI